MQFAIFLMRNHVYYASHVSYVHVKNISNLRGTPAELV